MIEFRLGKSFPSGPDFFFEGRLPEGELTAILGSSGSGKTTFASLLAGLLEPDEGRFSIGKTLYDDTGQKLHRAPEARGIGFVFQHHRLFPAMSVRENILFPVRFGGRKPLVSLEETVGLLHIESLLERRPGTLSGGEAQRVSLARALMAAQNLLILDEATASLDPPLRAELVEGVAAVAARTSLSILYITHQPKEARRLAKKALFLAKGRIVDYDETDVVLARHGFTGEDW